MLNTKLINPLIMEALSLCGHGSKILIADGNYPLAQKSGAAHKVYLGLTSGVPTVPQVLEAIHSVCPLERAQVMKPDNYVPEIYAEFSSELKNLELETLNRMEFYEACASDELILAVSTGEKRTFANILLTVGCT